MKAVALLLIVLIASAKAIRQNPVHIPIEDSGRRPMLPGMPDDVTQHYGYLLANQTYGAYLFYCT